MDKITKTLLYEWADRKLPEILERDLKLEEYTKLKVSKIIVLTGFRRVGKTYLLLGLINKLLEKKSRKNVLYLNFEDERIPARTEFLSGLVPATKQLFKEKVELLFLDEIQVIPNWSKWLRRIYDTENLKIFVSGSSSKMSSREIPTELRGRFLEIKVFPLSLREFLRFKKLKFDFKAVEYSENQKAELIKAVNEFIEFGSLPEIVLSKEEKKTEIAHSYYQTVVGRDIIERHKIKNEIVLKAMLSLLLNSTKYSITKLYNSLKGMNYKIGKTTIQKYLGYIENSYFMFSVPIFSYKIKEQMQYARKAFFIDNVFVSKLSTGFSKNYGRLYENAVAVELKRRGKKIFYWESRQKEEVDFVVKEKEKVKQLIQVCFNAEEIETEKRETKALIKASKELKCTNLIIITESEEKEKNAEWFGTKRKIKFIPFWKWMVSKQ